MNQLNQYFRKPELKVKLPSQGQYYPPGAVKLDANGEVDVYPMTAADELTMKTPDALLTGESTVKVIQSCVPAIPNAWLIPSMDVDVILIGIRIATYGPKMSITSNVPKTGTKQDNDVNLQGILETMKTDLVPNTVQLDNGLKIICKPMNYQQLSLVRRTTFEKQRMARTLNDTQMSDEDKQKEFNKIFETLTNINVESLISNIESIVTPEGSVNDRAEIDEFIKNVKLQDVNKIRAKVEEIGSIGSIPPLTAESPDEDIEKGAPKTYEVPVLFDNSDFFAYRS
jgi:hypothetical protein